MSAALETKTTPKQGVRPWDFDFCAFLCRGANIATFPDGEIHSKMEIRGPKQILPASKLMHIEPTRLLREDQDGLWLLR